MPLRTFCPSCIPSVLSNLSSLPDSPEFKLLRGGCYQASVKLTEFPVMWQFLLERQLPSADNHLPVLVSGTKGPPSYLREAKIVPFTHLIWTRTSGHPGIGSSSPPHTANHCLCQSLCFLGGRKMCKNLRDRISHQLKLASALVNSQIGSIEKFSRKTHPRVSPCWVQIHRWDPEAARDSLLCLFPL